MAKTYAVGQHNTVSRLDDHTGPWIELTTLGNDDSFWRDVMTDPNDENKVFIVGTSLIPTAGLPINRSIQVSTDGGATWNVPGGTWSGKVNYLYEVWCVDSNIIWAVGAEGNVVLSTDGGLTFNTVPAVVGSGTYFQTSGIHALNDRVAIVIGSPGEPITQTECYVWKTVNGGAAWSLLGGGSLPAPQSGIAADIGNANGIWMSPDQQKIIATTGYNHYISTDGGTTWIDIIPDIHRSGVHLTWFPSYDANPQFFRHTGGFFHQVLESIDSGLSYTEIRGLPLGDPVFQMLGAHFYGPYSGYYGYTTAGVAYIDSTTDGGATGTLSHTNSTVGATYEAIWTSGEVPPYAPCYELSDCAGILSPIYTQSDLSAHVDTVITLADDTNHEIEGCWFVTATDISCPDSVQVSVYRCYVDCEECLPPPPEPIRPCPRPVDPGYNTGLCDPSIVETVKCSYSEMMYQKMMSKRFNIKYCCSPNEMDIVLEKENIDLLLMKGEDPTPDPCDPQCHSYQIDIAPEDSAVTTYVDCYEEAQTIITPIGNNGTLPTNIGFCALDSTPPTTIVTHEDDTTDTYVLEPIEDCIPPYVEPDTPCPSMGCVNYILVTEDHTEDFSFNYIGCNEQIITWDITENEYTVVGDGAIAINICGIPGQTFPWVIVNEVPFSLTGSQCDACANERTCDRVTIIVPTGSEGTIAYINCEGALGILSIVDNGDGEDTIHTICTQADSTVLYFGFTPIGSSTEQNAC